MSTVKEILNKVKQAIREPFAWPGGYPCFALMKDGEFLCADCAKSNFRSIVDSTKHNYNDGWCALGSEINYEGTHYCGHCSAELESAYGEEKPVEKGNPQLTIDIAIGRAEKAIQASDYDSPDAMYATKWLLCDLMHYAKKNGFDFCEALKSAEAMHNSEIADLLR